MFEQFLNNFRAQLQSPSTAGENPAAPKPISGVGLAFSALKAAITGHSGSAEPKPDPARPDANKPSGDPGAK
jgi:hypothetical protein